MYQGLSIRDDVDHMLQMGVTSKAMGATPEIRLGDYSILPKSGCRLETVFFVVWEAVAKIRWEPSGTSVWMRPGARGLQSWIGCGFEGLAANTRN